MEFKKYDTGKLCWNYFPWEAAAAVLKVMTFGSDKYGWNNWRLAKPQDHNRIWSAALRHMLAHLAGVKADPETGFPPLWHAACCLMFLCELTMPPQEEAEVSKEQQTLLPFKEAATWS